MYAVSQDFMTAAALPVTRQHIAGTIYNGQTALAFNDENVLDGSMSITNQCSDTGGFSLGAVYVGQMSCTFRGLSIAKNAYVGKSLTVSCGLTLADQTVEYVPMGVYTISEASWDEEGVRITAYDNMSKFDLEVTSTSLVSGTPYAIISAACTACGVTLGTTQAAIEALANGTATLTLSSESSDIESYRDLLSWIMVTCCAFATIDRQGQLVIRSFGATSVLTVPATSRVSGASFGDGSITYSGVKVKAEDGTDVLYGSAAGNVLSLGQNPYLQGSDRDTRANAVLTALGVINYTPCTVELSCGFYVDLGDILTLSGGRGNSTDLFAVMYYEWTAGDVIRITGIPKASRAASRSDKQSQALANMIQANAIACMTPTSSSEDDILDGNNADVLMFAFEIKEGQGNWVSLHTMLNMSVETTVDDSGTDDEYGDCTVTVTYTMDDSYVDAQTQTYSDGDHILTLDMLFEALDVGIHILTVNLAVSGGNIT